MKKDSSTKNKTVHHGELLRELADWKGGPYRLFAKKIGVTEKTLYNYFKKDFLPPKDRNDICKAMKISADYFEGKIAVDSLFSAVNEEVSAYESKYDALYKKYCEASEQIIELLQENRQLRKEIEAARKEKKTTPVSG